MLKDSRIEVLRSLSYIATPLIFAKISFQMLALCSYSFNQYPRLMTGNAWFMIISVGRDQYRLITTKIFAFSIVSVFRTTEIAQSSHCCNCFAWSNIQFFVLLSLLVNVTPKIFELLNLLKWYSVKFLRRLDIISCKTEHFSFGGADNYSSNPTCSCKAI